MEYKKDLTKHPITIILKTEALSHVAHVHREKLQTNHFARVLLLLVSSQLTESSSDGEETAQWRTHFLVWGRG